MTNLPQRLPLREDDDAAIALRDLARTHATAAIRALVNVMEDDEQKGAARVLASKAILERGFGAPERSTKSTLDVNVYDARTAHYEALKKHSTRKLPKHVNEIDGEFKDVTPEKASSKPKPKSEFEE